MFFESWYGIIRVVIVGLLIYTALIFLLRISGKRTLSKWNAFDFVVTVALGSTLAAALLTKDVMLAEGVVAFALLIGLQYLITHLSVRSKAIRRLIKSDPAFLLEDGKFLHEAMKKERVTESEIRAAVRKEGIASLEEVLAVVLETDGSFSVVKKSDNDFNKSALSDVSGSIS
jgi:uncharacterized membrane protein YcaP (DUF421 family)